MFDCNRRQIKFLPFFYVQIPAQQTGKASERELQHVIARGASCSTEAAWKTHRPRLPPLSKKRMLLTVILTDYSLKEPPRPRPPPPPTTVVLVLLPLVALMILLYSYPCCFNCSIICCLVKVDKLDPLFGLITIFTLPNSGYLSSPLFLYKIFRFLSS